MFVCLNNLINFVVTSIYQLIAVKVGRAGPTNETSPL